MTVADEKRRRGRATSRVRPAIPCAGGGSESNPGLDDIPDRVYFVLKEFFRLRQSDVMSDFRRYFLDASMRIVGVSLGEPRTFPHTAGIVLGVDDKALRIATLLRGGHVNALDCDHELLGDTIREADSN
jgi:hypothetical protein